MSAALAHLSDEHRALLAETERVAREQLAPLAAHGDGLRLREQVPGHSTTATPTSSTIAAGSNSPVTPNSAIAG